MTDHARARRYLLGLLGEDERAATEREYFQQAGELERLEDAEEELIEDYLEDRLSADEREPFEREYLASPLHRTRVDTIRQLQRRAQSLSRQRHASATWLRPRGLIAAAAALLVLAVGLWMAGRQRSEAPVSAGRTQSGGSAVPRSQAPRRYEPSAPPAASVLAVELSPLSLRSAGQAPPVVIPAGTDLVDLRFEHDTEVAPPAQGTVIVTTVDGAEAWRGPLAMDAAVPHVRVPASALAPNDYLVNVDGLGRYVLRVR